MSVEKVWAFGNPNVGVYILASNRYAIIPVDAPDKVEKTVRETLKVEVYRASISSSPLLGVFAIANSNGILLNRFARESEVSLLKKLLGNDVNVGILDVRENALGNLVLANDKKALVSPLLPRSCVKAIEEYLCVETEMSSIAGSPLVGSMAIANGRGVLVTPLASDDELEAIREFFGVKVDVGTVNRGSVFLRAGMVVNDKGAIVGYNTTGPELMRIHQVLF